MTRVRARVLLADDHPVVRGGVRAMLEREPDLHVVAEAATGLEAVELAMACKPELAILDISMPGLTGLQATRQIVRQCPQTQVLILSMHANDQYCLEARRAGAAGYVRKSAVDLELVSACRSVLAGGPFLSPPEAGNRPGPANPLTSREGEVVKLVAEGHTTREIAGMLVISEKTVERHKGNVLGKLGLRDRVDITRYAIRRGLVEL